MIFEFHPPEAAGPLLIGATGNHTVEALRQLCVAAGSWIGWVL